VLLQAFAGDLADELLLGGQQVLPAKILASGFEFRHPTLASALADLFGARPARKITDAPPQATCAARQEPAGTAPTLARVASPALQSGNRVAPASVELARGRD